MLTNTALDDFRATCIGLHSAGKTIGGMPPEKVAEKILEFCNSRPAYGIALIEWCYSSGADSFLR